MALLQVIDRIADRLHVHGDICDARVISVQSLFNLVGDFVAFFEAQVAIGLRVQVDDDGVGGAVGAHSVAVFYAGDLQNDGFNSGDVALGNIDKDTEVRAYDIPGDF